MNMASLNTTRLVAVCQSLQVQQVRYDAEPARYHQNTVTIIHSHTCSMWATEEDKEVCSVVSLCMVQQIASQTPVRLDESAAYQAPMRSP